MKAEDIEEFELGHHCFGEILRVGGKDYEDLEKEDVLEFINDMFENDLNSKSLIRETVKNCLEHLQYDPVESSSDTCEQCGNWNDYVKYRKGDEDN